MSVKFHNSCFHLCFSLFLAIFDFLYDNIIQYYTEKIKEQIMLSLVDKVFQDIYNADRFIQTKGFRKYRFDDSNFYCLGTTVRSSNGYELTIAFNMSRP